MIRYSGEQWTVSEAGTSFVLRATTARHELHRGRVLLVRPEGVLECSRDGKDTPLLLIDCATNIHERCALALKPG